MQHKALIGLLISLAGAIASPARVQAAADVSREVLAFYYGWYGTPTISGQWRHWQGVNPTTQHIHNSIDFPKFGAYDSHDPAIVDRQAEAAHAAGITGFIASWWGRASFEDQGLPLLLAAGRKHKLAVSAYYEKISGDDTASRIGAAISDIDYLLAQYSSDKVWLHFDGRPVLFVYGRALRELSAADWQVVVARVRRDNPAGIVLIADSLDRGYVTTFEGASTYNITGQTKHKSPSEIAAWAQAEYPKMVAAAGPGRITTVTIIPGYDDRSLGRLRPRPVTSRWGGETYRALWRAAIAAAPDWVLLTSWNEWHEGSEIEASVEYGSRILDDTGAFSREFLARQR
jgi:glycoprotein endo-alpha-1,2-mannosidase